jgi:hypothetical protein
MIRLALALALAFLASACSSAGELPEAKVSTGSRGQYQAVDPRALDSDHKTYLKQRVTITGEVLGVSHYDDHSWAQIRAEIPALRNDTQSIIVYFLPKNSRALRGERFQVFGEVYGRESVTRTATGAKDEATVIVSHFFDKLEPRK